MAVRATFKRTSGVLCYSSSSPFSDGFRCWDEDSTMLAANPHKGVLGTRCWDMRVRWPMTLKRTWRKSLSSCTWHEHFHCFEGCECEWERGKKRERERDRANGVKIEMKSTIDGVAIVSFFLSFFFVFVFYLTYTFEHGYHRENNDRGGWKNFLSLKQNCLARSDRIIFGDHRVSFVLRDRTLINHIVIFRWKRKKKPSSQFYSRFLSVVQSNAVMNLASNSDIFIVV